MIECTEVTQIKRFDSEFDDAFLNDVDAGLRRVERKMMPAGANIRLVLDRLSDRLFDLHNKGYTSYEIASLLASYSIEVSGEMVKDYISHAHTRRLLSCEETLAQSYRSESNTILERNAAIARGLRQALQDDRGLTLFYQPQIDVVTGRVIGAEALLRWNVNGTLIAPAEFIPVAEAAGLIGQVGEWVLREACREAKKWRALGLGDIRMSVNLSVKQFSEKLPDVIHGILCDIDLPADAVGLEITESFLAGRGSIAILNMLRDAGIHLSIDDFGTGYSCLSQLKDLPLNTIKIDRAFVSDLGHRNSSNVVVSTIIDLARKLNIETLAEGVETAEQARILLAMGCSVFQGFLYSRPLSSDTFVEFVRTAHFQMPGPLLLESSGPDDEINCA